MIGIITNPNALGLVRDQRLGRRLADLVGQDGVVFETRTPDELRQAVRELRAQKVDVIATCGGDGTNLTTITEVVRAFAHGGSHNGQSRLPAFGILRGGTVNTVAGNLGVHGHPEEILARLCERYRQGGDIPSVEHDLLGVNGMYGFLFGAAMPGRFFEAYYGGPRAGVAWAAALAARTVGSGLVRGRFARWMFSPTCAEVTVDGQALAAREFTLIVAATVRDVGLGVKPTYRAGTEPGRFHLVASSLSAGRLVAQAARVFAGRPLRGSPHTDVLAERAEIRFAEPQTYTLDGDLFRADKVELACGPRLRILTP
jgi:diacylglycerol kinase family enzyme